MGHLKSVNDHTLTKTAGGSGDGTTMVTTKAEDAGQVDGSVEYPQDLLLGSDNFAPSSLYFSQVDGDPGDEEEETGTFCHQTKCCTRFSSNPSVTNSLARWGLGKNTLLWYRKSNKG